VLPGESVRQFSQGRVLSTRDSSLLRPGGARRIRKNEFLTYGEDPVSEGAGNLLGLGG